MPEGGDLIAGSSHHTVHTQAGGHRGGAQRSLAEREERQLFNNAVNWKIDAPAPIQRTSSGCLMHVMNQHHSEVQDSRADPASLPSSVSSTKMVLRVMALTIR